MEVVRLWLLMTVHRAVYYAIHTHYILHTRPIVLVPYNVTGNCLSVLFYWPTLRARSGAELSNFPHLFTTRLFGSIFSRRLLSPTMVVTMALSSDSLQKRSLDHFQDYRPRWFFTGDDHLQIIAFRRLIIWEAKVESFFR